LFPVDETTGKSSFKSKSGKEFNINLSDFNQADQPAKPKGKQASIL
jgi:hypothetical protein